MGRHWHKPVGMSPEAWRRYRECGSKVAYRHRSQARREAHKRKQSCYECSQCGLWHLTSKEVPRA